MKTKTGSIKKILSLLLCCCMLLSMNTAAFAEESCADDAHNYVEDATAYVAPGCAEGKQVFVCDVCGDISETVLPAVSEHSWPTEGVVTTEATCAEGEKTFTCTVCGAEKKEAIPAVSEHSWPTEGVVTTEATCSAKGEETFTCTVCGDTKTGELELKPHSFSEGACVCGAKLPAALYFNDLDGNWVAPVYAVLVDANGAESSIEMSANERDILAASPVADSTVSFYFADSNGNSTPVYTAGDAYYDMYVLFEGNVEAMNYAHWDEVTPLACNKGEDCPVTEEGMHAKDCVKTKAVIGEAGYTTLQAAINAAGGTDTVTLVKDVTESVTINEKVGQYLTIDGAGKTLTGTITVKALSDTNDNRRTTIKDINFASPSDVAQDFISSVETNHYPRITVSGCAFTGDGMDNDVAIRLKSAYGAVISGCTGTGLHSFLQNTSGVGLTVENVTVSESKGGLSLGTVQGVTVSGCNLTTRGYGIRIDADTYNNNATISDCTVNAFIPVVVRKVNTNSNITFSGTNTMTQSNTDGYWCVIGTTEYEENGNLPASHETGKVSVSINDASMAAGIYGNYIEAEANGVPYSSLKEAMAAGGEVKLLKDVTVSEMIVVAAGSTVSLDLNGFDITTTADSSGKHAYAFNNQGTLTIDDSVGGGVIKARGIYNGKDGGSPELIIKGGTIEAADVDGGYCIKNVSGSLTIDGGSFKAYEDDPSDPPTESNYDATVLYNQANVTINGGEFVSTTNWTYTIRNMSGSMTIGGGTVKGAHGALAVEGGTVTVNGGEFECTGITGQSDHCVYTATEGQLTVNGGSFTGDGETSTGGTALYADENSSAEIKGGEFANGSGAPVSGKGDVAISGGTFSKEPDNKYVHSDYETVENEDGTFGVKVLARCTDGTNTYPSLAAAMENAPDGSTITLLEDIIFNEDSRVNSSGNWYEGLYYTGSKSFTIDLGGFTIGQNGSVNDYLMLFKNTGSAPYTITFKNGTIDAGSAFAAICTSTASTQKITINTENIEIIGNNSNGAVLKPRGGAELNIKSGTEIVGNNNYVGIESYGATTNIYDGASIEMKGTDSYVGCLVGASGNGVVNVYGGEGTGAKGGFIVMTSGGTINVSGGEWTANTNGADASDNKAVLISQSADGAKCVLKVTGGTFKGGYCCYGGAEGDAKIEISGGNFNVDPSSYVISGYKAESQTDGTYNVVVDSALAEAKIGDTYYPTLEEAMEAAKDGDTVTVIKAISEDLTIDKNIGIDIGENGSLSGKITVSEGKTLGLAADDLSPALTVKGSVKIGENTVELPDYAQLSKSSDGKAEISSLSTAGGCTVEVNGQTIELSGTSKLALAADGTATVPAGSTVEFSNGISITTEAEAELSKDGKLTVQPAKVDGAGYGKIVITDNAGNKTAILSALDKDNNPYKLILQVNEKGELVVGNANPDAEAPIMDAGADGKDYLEFIKKDKYFYKYGPGKLHFICNGFFDALDSVVVRSEDGKYVKEIGTNEAEMYRGSTEIKLKNSYLKTLATGKYTITLTYEDGQSITAPFSVGETPATGDSGYGIFVFGMGMSLAAMLGILFLLKKKSRA